VHDRAVLRAALLEAVNGGLKTVVAAASAVGCSVSTVHVLRRADPEFDRLFGDALRRNRVPRPPAWAAITDEEAARVKAVVLEARRAGRPLREVRAELGETPWVLLRHLRQTDPEFNRALHTSYYPQSRKHCSVPDCPDTRIKAKEPGETDHTPEEGLRMGGARLTSGQVADARRRYGARTASCADLARERGVPLATMRHALDGTTWAGLRDPAPVSGDPNAAQALTPEQVAEARIQVARDPGVLGGLADVFGVDYTSLAEAVYGITWRHLTDPPPLPRPAPTQAAGAAAKLDEATVAQLRRDHLGGEPMAALARRAGVDYETVRNAVHGVTWRRVTDPPPVPVADVGGSYVLTEDDDAAIVRLRDTTNLPWTVIGKRYGVTASTALRAYRRALRDTVQA